MKTNIQIPHLSNIGMSRAKLLTFLEICRHPDGISLRDISDNIQEAPQMVSFSVKSLVKFNYVRFDYKEKSGKICKICYATPYGVDVIQTESELLCKLLSSVKRNMVATPHE